MGEQVAASPAEPTPGAGISVRFYLLPQKEQEAQRSQHHRREHDAERGPGCSPRAGSRESCF
jgi:hypothetical protein